jgi:hypothetical protein
MSACAVTLCAFGDLVGSSVGIRQEVHIALITLFCARGKTEAGIVVQVTGPGAD